MVTAVATENATSVTVDDERFEVADGNLKLTAGTMLDFESDDSPITVTIEASGDGDSATHVVTVSIGDVNEDPTVTITPGAVVPEKFDAEGNPVTSNSTVAENAMGSTVPPLALIEITDPDDADSDMLTGALGKAATSVSDPDNFEVILDPLNGLWLALKAGASLDYESTGGSVMVTVTFTDSDGNTAEATAEVMVTDANDDPMFAESEYAFDLNENADGSTTPVALGMVSATDEDAGDTHTYSITAGNEDGLFAIDAASGAITYVGTGENYRSLATGAAHTLTVSVSDGTASAEATVAVTVLNVNEAPVFGESAYAFDLGENQDGSTDPVAVGKVSATDPDEGDPITYTIVDDDEDPDNNLFAIDHYGNITYTGTGEDAESETTSYELMVSASDGGESSDVMVTVTVADTNDNAPEFVFDEGTTFYTFTLAENTDGSETAAEVGTVSATDPDGDAVTYSIVDDDVDPDNNLFAIDAESGAITYVGTGEDYESAIKSHVLTVQASDGSSDIVAQATVNVGQVNEAPVADAEMAIGTFAFLGGEDNSMEVDLKALFSDPDGDSLTYSLSSGAPDWLHFSVTRETVTNEAGEEIQTVTGRVYSDDVPAGSDMSATVSIVASDVVSDGDSLDGHAMFDVVVDAENADPSSIDLRITDADGLEVRTDTVTIPENEVGAVIGMVTVTDADDARHPHGQHTFTFTVDGVTDDRFEVTADGYLKLKDEDEEGEDVSLNHEDAATITLTITATDKAVGAADEAGEDADEAGEDADDAGEDADEAGEDADEAGEDADGRGSVSTDIIIKVRDVDAGDGPVANEIGDWWVTVDEDLDEDDVRDGDWLSFRLRMDGLDKNPAFSAQDGDTLTFDLSDDSPKWLQIDNKGRLTNKEGMLPERGKYTVTVIATDEPDDDGNTNSAETSFTLAVAISDDGDRDNDRPDIRDVIEHDYTENGPAKKVAEFTIRDDDLEIAPHPYGLHKVTLSGTYANRFKLVPLGDEDNDPQTAQYEIWIKTETELGKGDDGEDLTVAVKPLDYDAPNGAQEEIDITVTVTDGGGFLDDDVDAGGVLLKDPETDSRVITIDIDDAPDAAPAFSKSSIEHDDVKVGRTTDEDELGTTTLTVNQEESNKIVVVVQLSGNNGVWSDVDSDEDDLEFTADTSGLPDWVTVYGPDDWEDIYERRGDVARSDGPGVRSGDEVVVIVIDRTTGEDGDNVQSGTGLASFELTAEDGDGNPTTETISINVTDTNVAIVKDDDDPVVKIDDDTLTGTSTGFVTMTFDAGQDPDLDDYKDAVLVLYTWSTLAEDAEDDAGTTEVDEGAPVVDMVSTSPQSFMLDRDRDGDNDYVGSKIIATVEYYEIDPVTKTIVKSEEFTDDTGFIDAPEPDEGSSASVSFDFTTSTTGLSVAIRISDADNIPTGLIATLQASENEESGWLNVAVDNSVDLNAGVYTASLDVDADANGTPGDGGGLFYRVVLTYTDGDDQMKFTSPDSQPLGDLGDPDTDRPYTAIIGGTDDDDNDATPRVTADGEAIRVNTGGESADVQWQMTDARGMWRDIPEEEDLTLDITSDYAGRDLRAKVIYMTQEDDDETTVDESEFPTWVEYTEVVTVSGDIENNDPAETQASTEIEVELATRPAAPATGDRAAQPAKLVMGSVADLFFDSDGDDLTYSITTVPELNLAAADGVMGTEGEHDPATGGLVFRTYATEFDTVNMETTRVDDLPEQMFAIDKDTGEITYITGQEQNHDGDPTDGAGNTLTFTVAATDNLPGTEPATLDVTVRVNVAPTAIALNDGTATAANLPAPKVVLGKHTTGTALTDVTYMDDVKNVAAKVADLDVMDQNFGGDASNSGHPFGTHEITLSGAGANMFEIREEESDDDNGSTWELWLKKDATFNFEKLKGTTDTDSTTLYITVTATDNEGSDVRLSTKGVFTVKVMDVEDTEADLKQAEIDAADEADEKDKEDEAAEEAEKIRDEGPEVPGLKDDSDDGDDDGAVPPPPEDAMMGFAPGDDLLDSYVLAIDDIDVA